MPVSLADCIGSEVVRIFIKIVPERVVDGKKKTDHSRDDQEIARRAVVKKQNNKVRKRNHDQPLAVIYLLYRSVPDAGTHDNGHAGIGTVPFGCRLTARQTFLIREVSIDYEAGTVRGTDVRDFQCVFADAAEICIHLNIYDVPDFIGILSEDLLTHDLAVTRLDAKTQLFAFRINSADKAFEAHETAAFYGKGLLNGLASVDRNTSCMRDAEVSGSVFTGHMGVMNQNETDPEYGQNETKHGFAFNAF